jgi:hypothetical protein
VPSLILILRDLCPAPLSAAAQSALPRLPALEKWLAQGTIEHAGGGWRPWLQRRSPRAALHTAPPASIGAAAVPALAATAPVWFATPVHLVAGLDTVRVHPAGLLCLSAEEQRTLEQDFQRVFEGSGCALHATGRREMLLAGGPELQSLAVRSHDPALWLGADPRDGLPAGPGAEGLRRLGAEMEMWLHEHPVNHARRARGALNATALWLWGGGAPAIPVDPRDRPDAQRNGIAWAEDLFVDGLAELEGLDCAPLPQQWPAMPPEGPLADEAWRICVLAVEPHPGALQDLERRWIAPVLGQWRQGQLDKITLLAGTRAVSLGRGSVRSLWRRFRRPHPWWESLLQC